VARRGRPGPSDAGSLAAKRAHAAADPVGTAETATRGRAGWDVQPPSTATAAAVATAVRARTT
jgi:hypothetical protein